jgi:hypothetical protein
MCRSIKQFSNGPPDPSVERRLLRTSGMGLFPDIVRLPPYRVKALRDLRRVSLDLEYERRRAGMLKRAAATNPALALKASAAEVRVAVLQARAAQLRRTAGRAAA